MTAHPFHTPFEALPATIPVFPLTGALLLPGGRLPLNIFEPRYLAMIDDALATDRLIGMIQPQPGEGGYRGAGTDEPDLYSVGCAGRLSGFAESDDGRYLITLSGVCRFRVEQEMPTTRGYRRCQVSWGDFERDLDAPPESIEGFEREPFEERLQDYLKICGLRVEDGAVSETPDERLITSLAMICPFEPSEKQALLEARTLADRARVMTALVDLAVAANDTGTAKH